MTRIKFSHSNTGNLLRGTALWTLLFNVYLNDLFIYLLIVKNQMRQIIQTTLHTQMSPRTSLSANSATAINCTLHSQYTLGNPGICTLHSQYTVGNPGICTLHSQYTVGNPGICTLHSQYTVGNPGICTLHSQYTVGNPGICTLHSQYTVGNPGINKGLPIWWPTQGH